MSSFLRAGTILAIAFSSTVHGRPAPSQPSATSSTSPAPIILSPIKTLSAASSGLLSPLSKRATPASLIPKCNVTLNYASSGTINMAAQIAAAMAYPAILLEDIETVTAVDCSASSVDVTFGNQDDYEKSLAIWPSSDFLLFTNHLGDCDVDNERGLYSVSSMAFNNASLTITASATRSNFENSTTAQMEIAFVQAPASSTARRDITQSFVGNFSSTIALADLNFTAGEYFSVSLDDAQIGGHLGISGKLNYDFWSPAKSTFYVDADLGVEASAVVEVAANVAYDGDVYTYSPAAVSVSAFSIAGILDVGPIVKFALGVEVAVSASVEIKSGLTASYGGLVHLDLMDSSQTSTSGWTPVFTHQTNISAAVEAQVNPHVSVTAAIGVQFLGGLLDLSSGITARPELINSFTVDGEFLINDANVTLPAPTETTCTNGLWFSSVFDFAVDAFVTQFYSVELYKVEIPIYDSGCWSWVDEIMNGSSG